MNELSQQTQNTSIDLTILNVQDPSSFASLTVGAKIEITGFFLFSFIHSFMFVCLFIHVSFFLKI